MPVPQIVPVPAASGGSPASAYAWDWSATTHTAQDGILDDLLEALGAHSVELGKGLQGWSQSVHAFDPGGYKTGAVYFGGGRDDVHVVSTSEQAHDARAAVVAVADARTSRVDTKVDTLVPFTELASLCEAIAGPRTKVTYMESRVGGESAGRTLYVGSPSSAVRVRLYEKWLESPGQYVEGVNRLEVQLRPPSRAKDSVSSWSPAETFCASKLTRRLADALGEEIARPASLEKARRTPDLEQSIEWMGQQYGNTVRKWLDYSRGDLGKILEYMEL